MKHDTPTIAATTRERTGTRYARRLRQAGRLPAIIYGHKVDPVSVSVDETEILRYLEHGAHVMNVAVEGAGTETCLVKDLQFGYLGDNVVHVDFARVDLNEEVTVHVHLVYVGEAHEAQRAGAILKHDITELTVTCKVSDIPEEIKVDLSTMDGTSLTAGELVMPEGIVLAEDPTAVVTSIGFVRAEAEPGEEAEVTADGAEPEVITEAKAEGGDGE